MGPEESIGGVESVAAFTDDSTLVVTVLVEESALTTFFPLADFSTLGTFFTLANFSSLVALGHLLEHDHLVYSDNICNK